MQGPRALQSTIFARAPGSDPKLREHDVVRLRGRFDVSEGCIVDGSIGTVVGIWKEGELYEVEFVDPVQAVVTVPAGALARIANER